MHAKIFLGATAALLLPAGMAAAQTTETPPAPAEPTAPAGAVPEVPAESGTGAAPETPATPETPAEPATGAAQTPRDQPAAIAPAAQADLQPAAAVFDTAGQPVGTIESAATDGAVITTGTTRVQIPLNGFGKSERGLVIGMTRAELEAAAAKAAPQR